MNRSTSLLFLSIAGLILFGLNSCKKEEKGPYMSIAPGELVIERNAGDLLEFAIHAIAGNKELRNLRITQKPENGVTTEIYNEPIYGQNESLFYVYTVPSSTNRVILTFSLYDQNGKSFTVLRDLYINSGSYMSETTGYDLYSINAHGANNAFQISNLTFYQLDNNPDSLRIDLVEKNTATDGSLSKALTSYSGIRFVRNNSFNYAEATATSAENSYTSSSPQQLITNIAVNDILITRYDTIQNKYAVIKITGIYDGEGTQSDHYTFNIKK